MTMAAFVADLPFLVGNAQGKSATDGFAQPQIADKTGLGAKYTFILEFDCLPCVPLEARSPGHEKPETDGDAGGAPISSLRFRSNLV
jgi:hypothetical protein